MKSTKLLKRVLPYFNKYKGLLFLDIFCASLTTICELVLPMIVRYITNLGINNIQALTIKVVAYIGIFYIVLRIIDTAANYFMASVGHITGTRIETDMRRDLFSHLQNLSFTYYDNTKVGQIMSRITNDLFDITEFAHHCPEEFFIAFMKIGVSFAILSSVNLYLTLIIFSTLPIMILCTTFFRKNMRASSKASRVKLGELNSQVEDNLLGIRVVQSFVNEDVEKSKFEDGNMGFLQIKKSMYRFMAGFQSTTRMFDGIMYITVVIAGSLFMMKGEINPADFTAYLLYVTTLLTSIRRIVDFTEQFQKGMTGIERFVEIMDTPIEIKDKKGAKELKNVKGEIKFENVNFSYSDNFETVLCNINLEINPGDNVALVGPSGGGKTTLCSLIPRFYNVSSGHILIDGKDINDLTLKSLRENIGIVQQDVYLFCGTVYENISYGKPDATKEEVVEASKKAGAHDFIIELKNGYDTYVGERGVKLSGGQKQRISIARVFLKDPPLLILDEATSALDNESEKIVQNSLENLTKGRTTLTIAHRLTTIKNSKKILVLTQKGIEETGTHEELLNKKGIYYKMNNV